MKKIKNIKNIKILILGVLVMALLSGCGGGNTGMSKDKISVVCTNFAVYDWTRTILGDNENIELKLLLDNGVDMHSYQATAADIARISSCDVLVMVGGESEEWLETVCAEATNKDMRVVRLFDVLDKQLLEEEVVEGMQEEHSHPEEEHHETEFDEHIWLSVKNAPVMCDAIKTALCEADPQNASQYESNYTSYQERLAKLDRQYEEMIQSAQRKVVLFGDRFPFRYLTEDYGLDYYAAFPGCSAETEASFYTVTYLAKKLDEENIPVVLVIENSKDTTAQTIINNSSLKNQEILVLNSLQSVTGKELSEGIHYIDVMEANLKVLQEALN
ncbi:MAG: metal ABC transporter substrate-binding protein [Lachnospiraceae bacterium]